MCVYLDSNARAESSGSIKRDEMSGVTISEQDTRKLQIAVS